MASKVKNYKWWLAHIKSWQKSEITQTEYCRINKLNHKSFSNWKLKQGKPSGESNDADIPVFISSPTYVPLIPVAISRILDSS